MESSRRFGPFQRLEQSLRKSLPIITPWFLVPMGFEVFAAFLQGCAENSLQDVLLFVVLPVAGWIIFSRYCHSACFGPTTAPSSVAAVIITMVVTYFFNISSAMSQFFNAMFGVLSILLGLTFWRMIKSNPGYASIPHHENRSYRERLQMWDVPHAVHCGDSARVSASSTVFIKGTPLLRVKHCRYCNVQVERYDHHCPAIYNCVGRKNHVLFLLMMLNFLVVEALYVGASSTYLDRQTENWTWWKAVDENMRQKPRVLGSALFVFGHILWQIPFLGFHVYCACLNLTTDELFHWESYADLHIETPPRPGRPYGGKEFVNPYYSGIRNNLVSFFRSYFE